MTTNFCTPRLWRDVVNATGSIAKADRILRTLASFKAWRRAYLKARRESGDVL